MWVLGVDPGRISGWALLDPKGKPAQSGQTGRAKTKTHPGYTTSGDEIRRVLVGLREHVALTDVTLGIEGQFLKDDASRDAKDRMMAVATLKTSRTAGKWIGVAEAMGVKVYHHNRDPTFLSQIWRMAVWGCRPPKDKVKAYAVKVTLAAWGISMPQTEHHRAEAMWIAKYVGDILRMEARQQGLPF